MEEDDLHTPKIDTKPLLSPNMELDFLKDGWTFPQVKEKLPKQEDNVAFNVWQENFQDLSGWCMDVFQTPCDFPIGESSNFKISGTKYEGNDVLTSEEGGLKTLTSVIDEEKQSIKMDSIKAKEFPDPSNSFISPTLLHTNEHKQSQNFTETNLTDYWMNASKTTSINRTPWSKQNNKEVNPSFHPEYSVGELDFDGNDGSSTCPTSTTTMEIQRESWDVLRTIETTGSDSFDLLSYVCDDEIRSPEGSTSTDSSMVSKLRSPVQTPTVTIQQSNPITNRTKKNGTTQLGTQSQTISTTTTTTTSSTSSTSITVGPTRRSERMRKSSVTKVEEDSDSKETRFKSGLKRFAESDSDDDNMSIASYRESREKNNEASRKSRMNKKAKEKEMAMKAVELEKDNRILKMKVEELEKLVTSMRNALLRSAMKKEI